MIKSYLKGRNYEYEVAKILKKAGYHTAYRSAGSHGPIDLTAIKFDRIVFIQVKSNKEKIVPALRLLRDVNPQLKGVICEVWKRIEGKQNTYEIFDLPMLNRYEFGKNGKFFDHGISVEERYFRNR